MYDVLLALGVLSLLYLLFLAARGVDFAWIWLPVGGLFLAVGGYGRYCVLHAQGFRLPTPVLVLSGVVLALLLAVFLAVEGLIFRGMLTKPQPGAKTLIILGAQVKGKVPSLALRLRLEKAKQYLQENPQTVAVLSGGQGDGEEITEAECMRRYLVENGVSEDRLILEDRSTSTLENLEFSAGKIAEREGSDAAFAMTGKCALLSNNFHVYRALLLARKCGYTDVQGIAAPSDWRLQIHYLVREFFALVKEKIAGNI